MLCQFVSISKKKLNTIRTATAEDEELYMVMKVVQ